MRAKFITFEGPDGAGKTTQLKLLGQWLEKKGFEVVYTREPGGTPLGETLRAILLDPKHGGMLPQTEVFLYAAARAQHVYQVILPSLEAGKIVLCDRYSDSTLAYQGFGRGLDLSFLQDVNGLATGGLNPDLTFILDIPPEEGLARRQGSGQVMDRLEGEGVEFFRRVREGFLRIYQENPKRCRLIPARGSILEVHQSILAAISPLLEE